MALAQISATIVALGDSTTAGTPGFRSPIEAPPEGRGDEKSQYAYWLMQTHPEWRVLNRGVNGERTDQIHARFERDVFHSRTGISSPAANPNAIIVIAGVNDVYQGRGADAVVRELEAMYGIAHAAGIPLVSGTILPFNMATPDQNARMKMVNDWIRDYASRTAGVVFCDTRAAVSAPGAPNRLVSSPDDLHPSPDGYRLMAMALEPAVKRALGIVVGKA